MSKYLLIGIIVITILVGLASGYYFFSWKKSGGASSIIPGSLTGKDEASADLTYEDESGFSFQYPKGIKVSDITPEDDQYYTKLSLTKGNEKLIISIMDTTSKTVETWLKGEGFGDYSIAGATTFGGISAKQYYSGGEFVSLAIDQGIVYSIVGPKDGGFWEDSQNVILGSFAFAGTKPATGVGDDTIYESEEVIE